MDYSLSRAITILRAAHVKMAAAEAKSAERPSALADLEALGVRTGALVVERTPRPRHRSRAA